MKIECLLLQKKGWMKQSLEPFTQQDINANQCQSVPITLQLCSDKNSWMSLLLLVNDTDRLKSRWVMDTHADKRAWVFDVNVVVSLFDDARREVIRLLTLDLPRKQYKQPEKRVISSFLRSEIQKFTYFKTEGVCHYWGKTGVFDLRHQWAPPWPSPWMQDSSDLGRPWDCKSYNQG